MSDRFETYAYLPPLSRRQLKAQAEHLLKENLLPVIEYLEEPERQDTYWHTWPVTKLAGNGAEGLMTHLEACRRANPTAHVRLSGYDRKARIHKMSFIVYVPAGA